MNTIVSIPDHIARHLVSDADELEHEVKLSYALRLYRAGKINEREFGEMLGFSSRLEVDQVLKENDCFIEYSESEVASQREALNSVLN